MANKQVYKREHYQMSWRLVDENRIIKTELITKYEMLQRYFYFYMQDYKVRKQITDIRFYKKGVDITQRIFKELENENAWGIIKTWED